MIACKRKPRWASLAVCQFFLVLASAFVGLAHAEVDINVSAEGVVTVAGKSRGEFFFGSGDVTSSGIVSMPINSWSTRSAGNGTGGANTNSAGNGTGNPQTNSAGNGTGRRELTMDWGVAQVVLGCNQAAVIVFRDLGNGQFRLEEVEVLSTDQCAHP